MNPVSTKHCRGREDRNPVQATFLTNGKVKNQRQQQNPCRLAEQLLSNSLNFIPVLRVSDLSAPSANQLCHTRCIASIGPLFQLCLSLDGPSNFFERDVHTPHSPFISNSECSSVFFSLRPSYQEFPIRQFLPSSPCDVSSPCSHAGCAHTTRSVCFGFGNEVQVMAIDSSKSDAWYIVDRFETN